MERLLEKIGTFCDFEDNSIKTVFKNKNGNIIEMTLLQNRAERDVVCVPTHYFCRMGCKMCHLTNFFSKKQQIQIPFEEFNEALIRTVCLETETSYVRRTYKKDILISFMGVGEPLTNIDLIRDVYLNNNLNEFGYENISYALATMFPNINAFDRLFDVVKNYNIPLKIHYSMHFPDDKNRLELIPLSEKKLSTILSKLNEYTDYVEHNLNDSAKQNFLKFHKHGGVEIHYTLIKDVNDADWCYESIKNVLNEYKNFCIKFIRFNEVSTLKRSEKTDEWINKLTKEFPQRVKFYIPPGRAIGSSCGEFTKHFFIDVESDEEKQEFQEWKERYEVKETIVDL